MSNDEFTAVKELIDQKKFDEARAVLRTMGRVPGIAKWWTVIDRLDPARAATIRGTPRVNPQRDAFVAQWIKQERVVGVIMSVLLVVLGVCVLIFAGDFWWFAAIIALFGVGLSYFTTQRQITEDQLSTFKAGQMRIYAGLFLLLGLTFTVFTFVNGAFYEPIAAIGNLAIAGMTYWRSEKIKQYEQFKS